MGAPKGNDFALGNEGGRPSKYDPAYCDVVIEKMREGYSKTAVAGFIGICKQTLLNWCDQHKEFFDAVKAGEAMRTMKLEGDLLQAPDGPTVTSRIFALKNAAPDEWRDKTVTENTTTVTHKGLSDFYGGNGNT